VNHNCFLNLLNGSLALLVSFLLCPSCQHKENKDYKHDPAGYYYRLLSFENQTNIYKPGCIMHLSAVFSTQSDSVFWDSTNNLNDRFYLKTDSAQRANLLQKAASTFSEGDSICVLVQKEDFFRQQFDTTVPFFSVNDTIVKINLKVKKIVCGYEVQRLLADLEKQELNAINKYLNINRLKDSKDSAGFYWVTRPVDNDQQKVKYGEPVKVHYSACFLNGRVIERSVDGLEFIYGTPDQVLTGLNFVIGKLKFGQTAKIILPSRLAFGEKGSSNGTVPPFTPLIYEIKVESAQSDKSRNKNS
jgi:FKBP-type peptidyl-prolyl cis-trans isomerase FkpA